MAACSSALELNGVKASDREGGFDGEMVGVAREASSYAAALAAVSDS